MSQTQLTETVGHTNTETVGRTKTESHTQTESQRDTETESESDRDRDRCTLGVYTDRDTNCAAFIYEINTLCLQLSLSLSASDSVAVSLWLYDRHKPGRIHIRETRRACERGA
jgi:hypothetical protein